MSQQEYEAMANSGLVQESSLNGVTSVTLPPNSAAYRDAAARSVYVEFDVPASTVRAADGTTAKIYGPTSIFGQMTRNYPDATRHWNLPYSKQGRKGLVGTTMRNELMLDEFRLWCRANEWKVKGEPVFAKTRRSEVEDETLTPPLYKASIDLKTEDILASFTVWGTGDMSVIIMNNHTAEELIVDDRHQQTLEDMHHLLNHYTALILSRGPYQKPD